MRVTLESTSKIVEFTVDGLTMQARIWEGTTASGIPCHAYITRIAVAKTENASEFERELLEQRAPTPSIAAIPTRLVL